MEKKLDTDNDINIVISSKADGVLLDEDGCTVINIVLKNTGEIGTSFLGVHNEFIIKELSKAQKIYLRALRKTLKQERKLANATMEQKEESGSQDSVTDASTPNTNCNCKSVKNSTKQGNNCSCEDQTDNCNDNDKVNCGCNNATAIHAYDHNEINVYPDKNRPNASGKCKKIEDDCDCTTEDNCGCIDKTNQKKKSSKKKDCNCKEIKNCDCNKSNDKAEQKEIKCNCGKSTASKGRKKNSSTKYNNDAKQGSSPKVIEGDKSSWDHTIDSKGKTLLKSRRKNNK